MKHILSPCSLVTRPYERPWPGKVYNNTLKKHKVLILLPLRHDYILFECSDVNT